MADFYDQIAPLYHLIHQDWNASLVRQGRQLAALIDSEWPGRDKLLDLSCGIGTQAIALALQGYSVVASDLSANAVARARKEATQRHVDIEFSVCDMRQAHSHHSGGFDVVLSCDNSVTHLLSDHDLLVAFEQMHACLADGGGCLVTVRDYEREERGGNLVRPYGVRIADGKRYLLFQVWDFEGDQYELTFFFIEEDLSTQQVRTHAMRTRYYAISTGRLCDLMREAGFRNVRKIDGAFYQPVLVGTKLLA
jgi:SAM-dependent methyltransferase